MAATSLTKRNSIIILIFYIGMIIVSSYGIYVLGNTWQVHDYPNIESYHCTCLTETEYQCFQEATRIGKSMYSIKCNLKDEHGEDKSSKFEFCDCGSRGTNRCYHPKCYLIERPVEMPDRCDDEKCNAFTGLRMWTLAAQSGMVIGAVAVILVFFSIYKAIRLSETNVDIMGFYTLNVVALIPPVFILISLLATDVQTRYASYELDAWAWTFAAGTGVPLCAGLTFAVVRKCFKAKNHSYEATYNR
ncbi:uncharacterized protein LOC119068019 [Bradysia coprophila]|uniref:uncharacterized protein LOC119068019 n=1 Tax=Bradysia coprophila TaxID=38358 RepID=UPI00187DD2A4|nr:uncharacterized protein LOC119068019 [Bradysia coprophila]